MIPNTLYKHKNNTDVAFAPISVVRREKDLLLFGRWYNIVNPTNVFFISDDEISIKLADVQKWEEFNVSTRGILGDDF